MTIRAIVLGFAAAGAVIALRPDPAFAQQGTSVRAKATAHVKQAQAYFAVEDFDRALAEYQAAFELSTEPALIFNIALCHDRANRPEQALAAFQRYLELVPFGAVADEAREGIARLTALVEKRAADRAAEEARRHEEARQREAATRREELAAALTRRDDRRRRIVRYVVLGGTAVAAAGATSHVLAWRTRERLQDAPDFDAYHADLEPFRLRRNIAIGAYAVGAVTIATGLILGRTVLRTGDGPQLSAAITPGGATVTVGWSR